MMGRYTQWSTREGVGLFLREWAVTLFHPFLVLQVWFWWLADVSFP